MKTALITGATGQDGSYLAELLIAKGYEVHGIKRRSSSFNTGRVDHIFQGWHQDGRQGLSLHFADLTDSSSITKLIGQLRPDEIYNLGAQSHVAVSFEIPEYTGDVVALGALRILESVRFLGLEKHTKVYRSLKFRVVWPCSGGSAEGNNAFLSSLTICGCEAVRGILMAVNYREAYGMFACNGILFNHESPRRGETFVTRKITRGLGRIAQGLETCLHMGNIDSLRDWGHAKDYVRMQWLMLQQEQPRDFVIATGQQYSVREFIAWSATDLGISLEFQGDGVDEIGVVTDVTGENAPDVKRGDVIVRIDPRYFRPAEVDTLLGDPSEAKKLLGWEPEISAREMCAEMTADDLVRAKKERLLSQYD